MLLMVIGVHGSSSEDSFQGKMRSLTLPVKGSSHYRPSLPADHPVFSNSRHPAPLLLIGSQSWNDPDIKTYLKTAKEREALVFQACSK